ncbi:GH92 family glycosyl hydrolase [Microbacterium sp. SSW1-49]|uniref:GH92 family glycosyl hydrolase n=1 Tax=Microbacterium croceum TaxID=2851645 RepID=A0ABT0FA55_9MICO|nr:GH92 family glycosyl hydrolase [Microbacterium croceum]MCK2034945.1 GH92 family glycosyl hydrolase [Microbacterium croceum]
MRTIPRPIEPASLAVTSGSGPHTSLTSRPGIGAVSPTCLRVEIPGSGSGRLTADLTFTTRTLQPGDLLEYYVFAEFVPGHIPDHGAMPWWEGGYAATGTSIDLLFSDGRRLVDAGARDHHGFGIDAEDQGRSRSISVDQWTRKEVDLSAFAGVSVVSAQIHVSAHASVYDAVAWVDGPFLATAPAPSKDGPVGLVDTRRGTHSSARFSRGNTVPATALPNGGVLIVPMTSTDDLAWPYSYHQHNDAECCTPFRGIALSHTATPWIGDWGRLHVRPVPADLDEVGSRFRHADEVARPHDYAVRLENDIVIRIAPVATGAIAAVRFAEAGGALILDQGPAGGEVRVIERDGRAVILVRNAHRAGMIAGAPVTHHAIALDCAFTVDDPPAQGSWATSLTLRMDVPSVTLYLATSTLGAEQALRRLDEAVATGLTVDRAVADAAQVWNRLLGRIRVDGASRDQLVTVYSSLYRLFLYPSALGEHSESGAMSPDVFAFRPESAPTGDAVAGDVVVNNGFWDTYRTAWPAYALFAPERAGHLLYGIVRHYQESGWVPRWTSPGFIDCMVGTSSDIVFADAVAKGVELTDLEAAYDSGIKNALVPSPERSAGRKGAERALFRGHVDDTVEEGLSWTLENAISDFALAELSRIIGERFGEEHPRAAEFHANAVYFRDRCRAYATMFDPMSGFFRGRAPHGAFSIPDPQFDPRVWGGDYVETNAFGMNFTAPHDGAGLARLLGGRDGLRRRLDLFFDTNERGDEAVWGAYGRTVHEMTEARDIRMGMFAPSNQPAHHIPYLYAHTDDKARMQQIVRESLSRLFLGSEFGQGYPGDEDNGEMSCWYLFGALGLYPLAPGSREYVITTPLFCGAEFDVADGRTVRIETRSDHADDVFIQRVRVDGEDWHRVTVDHHRLLAGCRIEIELGSVPSDWFDGSYPASVTRDDEDVHPLADIIDQSATVTGDADDVRALCDDDARTETVVTGQGCVCIVTEQARAVRLYTLTCGAVPAEGPSSWEVFAEDATGARRLLCAENGVTWRWPHETRVFVVPEPLSAHIHLLRIGDPEPRSLAELQLLAAR